MGNKRDLFEQDLFESNPPFWGNIGQLERLLNLVRNCIDRITESSNPREMVLETWLTLDYSIRVFLLNGFEIDRFCDDEFDLLYGLLPRGFEDLLRLLKDTIDFQSTLDRTPKPEDNRVTWHPIQFWVYVDKKHRAIWDQLGDIEMEYYKTEHPELYELETKRREGAFVFQVPKREVQRIPQGWMDVASSLDREWFRLARSLNRARNKAAHSYDVKEVGKAFGITGENLANLVRKRCLRLLNVLLKVNIEALQ